MAVGANRKWRALSCGRPLPVLMYSKHIEDWYETVFLETIKYAPASIIGFLSCLRIALVRLVKFQCHRRR